MAVADVYDALISRRVYKPAMSHAQAAQIIVEGRGHHFDPDVVAAFVSLEDDFQAITNRYSDSREAMETKVAFLSTVIGPTNDP
jgi:putative two-component system response regulator